jgi:hypothetical protein
MNVNNCYTKEYRNKITFRRNINKAKFYPRLADKITFKIYPFRIDYPIVYILCGIQLWMNYKLKTCTGG